MALDTTDKVSGDASARIDISAAAGTSWRLNFRPLQPVPVTAGNAYTLSFWAKADRPHSIDAWVQQAQAPWKTWFWFGNTALGTDWRRFEVAATATGTDTAANLRIGLGQAGGSVWLDGVVLQQGTRRIWRRDYENGVALVNTSGSSAIVPLGGLLRKIKGRQVPTLNDGSLVSRVTLPGRDGLVLLRPTGSPQDIATQAAGQMLAEWQRCASLSKRAYSYYVRLVPRSTGASRVRAMRARFAWQQALTATEVVSTRAAACRTAVASGDWISARSKAEATGIAAARAWTLVERAWHLGRAGGIGTVARRSAAAGREKVVTARVAIAALQ